MRGFTLVELVVVLGIALVLFTIVGALASNTLPKTQLVNETATVVATLRRAQALTVAGKQDSVWGVHVTATDMTLFAGASYAARLTPYDEVHAFPSGITPGGLTDVVFEALTGETPDTGTVTLTADATSESRTVTVSASGLIESSSS